MTKDEVVLKGQKLIQEEICLFYSNLYKSKLNKSECDILFESINDDIKKLDAEDKHILEEELTITEIENALKQMKNSKSPGIDGLTSEFLKHFWVDIKKSPYKAFLECIKKGCLSPTMKTGLITLLPKPKKDLLMLDNWRPITLLCNDYKLLALVYANRIKQILGKLVEEYQSAFIKGRYIHNHIRLILDMIDYQPYIQSESFVLFIDFFKAFDTVEHEFMFTVLKKLGFGERFCKVIKMFYNDIYSYISLNPGMTSKILRGIRQGCPISPKLFILCTQMLAYLIVNHPQIKGITIFDYEYRISQFADDTVIFLNDKSKIEKALDIISVFSRASGLCLNLKKCEILPLHPCAEPYISSIPVKTEVKYLGLTISKDSNKRQLLNIEGKIDDMKKSLNFWLMRDLSILGRILLTKAEGISKLVYPCQALYVPPQMIKKVNSIIFNFIWKNKTHYLKKSVMINEYKNGGLKAAEFESMIGVFKLNWIKAYLAKPNSIWFHIPKCLFQNVGGLEFLLRCDFDITKLPIKLSDFHRQILLYWKMMFTHNFTQLYLME